MPHAPRYLGLDIGTRTGYAIVERDKIIKSGVRDFSVKNHQHIGNRGIKFYNFLLELGAVDEIYYENIQFTFNAHRSDGGELYHGLKMVMNMYAAGFNVPTFGVWPGTLKKAFAGTGRAEKKDMCAAARNVGWRGGDILGDEFYHDEADAIALVVTQLRERYGIAARF